MLVSPNPPNEPLVRKVGAGDDHGSTRTTSSSDDGGDEKSSHSKTRLVAGEKRLLTCIYQFEQ